MKTKVRGSIYNTTFLSHCRITVDKGNEVIINPADWKINNLEITVKGKNNRVIIGENLVINSDSLKISVSGDGNLVELGEFNRFLEGEFAITVNGNGCTVITGKNCTLKKAFLSCRENGTKIIIGDYLDVGNDFFIDSMEGKSVTIGKRCLVSYNVQIRNTDGHSILSGGKRINPAKDVVVGNDVWVGQDVLFLKGAEIPDGSVVGARSIVSKKFENRNSVIFGQPAIEKRSDITWSSKRL